MSRLTKASDLENLSILEKKSNKPERKLETFPNHHPERDYTVSLDTVSNSFTLAGYGGRPC